MTIKEKVKQIYQEWKNEKNPYDKIMFVEVVMLIPFAIIFGVLILFKVLWICEIFATIAVIFGLIMLFTMFMALLTTILEDIVKNMSQW
jgi:hypothetical protein